MTGEHIFTISVIPKPSPGKPDAVQVKVDTSGIIPFEAGMCAAECLAHLVATQSDAGYEKALELIVQGAMQYRVVER